jgi:tape measure domain-containing protein
VASSEDDVVVRLRLKDVKAFIADVKAGKLAIEDLEKQVRKAGDTAGKVTAPGTGGLSKLGSHFGFLAGWARTGALALGAATVGVAGYALKSAASMEQVGVSMETMLGSAAKAQTMMTMLQKFAQGHPVRVRGRREAGAAPPRVRVRREDRDPLTAVGNAASGLGLGAEGMDRVVTALGQIRMKGRVQGDEMLQLAEAGINANAYLEKAFHLTPQQLQKAQQAGKISAAAAIPVILAGMDAQFQGLMGKQSHTLSGIWSNFHDSLQQGLVKAVNPFLPTIEGWLQTVTDKLPGILTKAGNIFTTVTSHIGSWVSRAMDVIPYLQSHGAQGADDAGAANIIARLFGDSDGKSAATIENLIGMMRNFGRVLTDVVFPVVRDTASALSTGLGGALAVAAPALEGMFGFIADHKEVFQGLAWSILGVVAAYKAIKIATWLWVAAQSALDLALDANPIGVVIMALAGLVTGLIYAYKHSETFRHFVDTLWLLIQAQWEWVRDTWQTIGPMLTAPFEAAAFVIKGIADTIAATWNDTVGSLGGPQIGGPDAAKSPVAGMSWWDRVQVLGSAVGGGGMSGVLSGLANGMAHQADGGTTTRPGLSWVGERGPELLNMPRGAQVIPLPRGGAMAGQPLHVHVEVNGREIATAVLDDLNARAARR